MEKDLREGPKGGGRGDSAKEDAEAKKAGGIATSEIHCEDAKDGGENGDSAYDEGVTEGGGFGFAISTEDSEVGDENTPDQADGVSFKDIRSHSGAVSHVVSDVVGDGSGIAGVIFFEFGFDFAHEVGSDVGSFGVDAASQTGKHANQGSTEGEAGETVDGGAEAEIFRGDHIKGSDREKGKGDDEQAGDGSAIERVAQGGSPADGGSLRGADIRHHGDAHASETGDQTTGGTDKEADACGKIFKVADRDEEK